MGWLSDWRKKREAEERLIREVVAKLLAHSLERKPLTKLEKFFLWFLFLGSLAALVGALIFR